MSIGTDDILLHAAGILRTVPDAKQIERFQATGSTLAELDAAFLGMAAAKVDPLIGLYRGVFDRVADGAGLDTFLIDAAFVAPVTGGGLFNVAVTNTAVIDGYIAGATIFVDANGNGVQDPGEFSAISDANGKFDMPEAISAAGTLASTGGKDLTTGQVNTTVLKAVAGPNTIAPLGKWVIEISAGRPPETTSAEG